MAGPDAISSRDDLRRFLQRKTSVDTLATEQSSVCTDLDFSISAGSGPQVRFVTTSNGEVECKIRKVRKLIDKELWWQPEELSAVRRECAAIVEAKSEIRSAFHDVTADFIARGWKSEKERSKLISEMKKYPELRGLEFHLVPECKEMIRGQRAIIRDVQSKLAGPSLIRLASRSLSQGFVALAVVRAEYDAQEAKAFVREPWDADDSIPCFD